MKPRRIVREKEACARLACGRTKFREDYKLNDPADPHVPGTEIPRVKPIPLGPVNVGFLDHEIDALIDALAEAGGHSESKAKNRKAARELAVTAVTGKLTPREAGRPSARLLIDGEIKRRLENKEPLPERIGDVAGELCTWLDILRKTDPTIPKMKAKSIASLMRRNQLWPLRKR